MNNSGARWPLSPWPRSKHLITAAVPGSWASRSLCRAGLIPQDTWVLQNHRNWQFPAKKPQTIILVFNYMFSFPNAAGADRRGAGGSDGGGDALGSSDGSQRSHCSRQACEHLCWGGICLVAVLHSDELPRCARIPAGCCRHGNPLAPLRRGHKSPPGSGAATLRAGADAKLSPEWWLPSPQ